MGKHLLGEAFAAHTGFSQQLLHKTGIVREQIPLTLSPGMKYCTSIFPQGKNKFRIEGTIDPAETMKLVLISW